MQPMNVLPAFVSQDADLKGKELLGSLEGGNKDADFSSLVEKHLQNDKEEINQKKTDANDTAKDSRAIAANGKTDVTQENSRQKSDLSTTSDEQTLAKDKKDNETKIVSGEEVLTDNDVDSEALLESEQFISLLYNSDQTLAQSANKDIRVSDKATTGQATTEVSEPDLNLVKAVSKETSKESNEGNKKDITTINSDEKIINEHKLKAFSKDELLASMQLKGSASTSQQSSEQVLKDYQNSLQSSQDKMKYNLDKEINPDAILLAKNKLKEAVEPGFGRLPVEPIGKVESLIDELTEPGNQLDSIKDSKALKEATTKDNALSNEKITTSLNALKQETSEESLNKASLDNQGKDSSHTRKVEGGVQLATNLNTIKVTTENTLKPSNENAIASDFITNNKLVNTQGQQQPTSIGQSQVQQQSIQQRQTQVDNNEATSSDESGNEDAYTESALLSQEKPKEQAVTSAGKVIDNAFTRSVSEGQAQAIQGMQTKQSNDAYFDHQSSEALNHSVASDTVQIQKNNVLLQQETISIFKKDFAEAVKDKVLVMINQKLQQFDITLDPPEFGNMQVRVNLQGEQAAVNFVVQNQQAKDALEQNMHKLKEMLSEQGVDVGGANVEQQNQQSKNDENNTENNHSTSPLTADVNEGDNVKHVLSAELFDSSATGVDYYA